MTLATQPDPAAARRASVTCTGPNEPLIVPALTVFARLPRLPAAGGTLINNAPPNTVTVAVVSPTAPAEDGTAAETASTPPTTAAETTSLDNFMTGLRPYRHHGLER
jgi:hypothetical protein